MVNAALICFGILFGLGMAPSPANASQIELSENQIHTTWNNINGALTVIAVSTALDDDWADAFKAMKPEPASGKTMTDALAAMATFRSNLNKLLAESELAPVEVVANGNKPADAPSVVYISSGKVMDSLISLLISLDPLAFVAHYYAWEDAEGKTPNDVYSVVALANKRMQVYMEENGIE